MARKTDRYRHELERLLTALQEGLNVSAETVYGAAMLTEDRPALHRKLDHQLDRICRLRDLLMGLPPKGGAPPI